MTVYIDVPELIANLRSGEFQQGRGSLSKYQRMCCLGVACETLASQGKIDKWRYNYDDLGTFRFAVDKGGDHEYSSASYLPEGVEFPSYMKIRHQDGEIYDFEGMNTYGGNRVALADLNDEGFSFNQIADILQYLYENADKGDVA